MTQTVTVERVQLEQLLDAFNETTAQKYAAITAIKEALAQPEQEPHSWYSAQEDEWMTHKTRKEHECLNSYTHKVGKFDLALYTTPPQRKPWVSLSDEDDIIGMARDAFAARYCDLPVSEGRIKALVKAVDAKLRELNEAPQRNG